MTTLATLPQLKKLNFSQLLTRAKKNGLPENEIPTSGTRESMRTELMMALAVWEARHQAEESVAASEVASFPQNAQPTPKKRKTAKIEKLPKRYETTDEEGLYDVTGKELNLEFGEYVQETKTAAPTGNAAKNANVSTTLIKDLEIGNSFKTTSGKSIYTVQEKGDGYVLCLCKPEGKKEWTWKMKGAELDKKAVLVAAA